MGQPGLSGRGCWAASKAGSAAPASQFIWAPRGSQGLLSGSLLCFAALDWRKAAQAGKRAGEQAGRKSKAPRPAPSVPRSQNGEIGGAGTSPFLNRQTSSGLFLTSPPFQARTKSGHKAAHASACCAGNGLPSSLCPPSTLHTAPQGQEGPFFEGPFSQRPFFEGPFFRAPGAPTQLTSVCCLSRKQMMPRGGNASSTRAPTCATQAHQQQRQHWRQPRF